MIKATPAIKNVVTPNDSSISFTFFYLPKIPVMRTRLLPSTHTCSILILFANNAQCSCKSLMDVDVMALPCRNRYTCRTLHRRQGNRLSHSRRTLCKLPHSRFFTPPIDYSNNHYCRARGVPHDVASSTCTRTHPFYLNTCPSHLSLVYACTPSCSHLLKPVSEVIIVFFTTHIRNRP